MDQFWIVDEWMLEVGLWIFDFYISVILDLKCRGSGLLDLGFVECVDL